MDVRNTVVPEPVWICENGKMKRNQTKSKTPQRTPVMSAPDFAGLGAGQVAYIKKIQLGNLTVFAIIAADGTRLGLTPCHKLAVEKLRQADYEISSIH